jgi:acetyltransferase-like isoleucine patch superfamily enzyme
LRRLRRLVSEPIRRVELEARLTRPWRLLRFHEFGEGAILHRPIWIYGPQQIAIGKNALILHGCWISVEQPAWGQPAPTLRIGERVGIRPYCSLSAAGGIELEDDVVLSAYSTVIDSDHTYEHGYPNIMHNPLEIAHVRVGRGTWIGERVAVLKGADIGECCIIGANSVVRGTIPPHSVAVGVPARVVGEVEGVDGRARPRRETLY